MKTVDFKSLVIGGLLVLLILCAVGAVPWLSPEYYQRFVVGATDNSAFIVDTATGQAWAFDTLQHTGFGGNDTQDFFAPKAEFPAVPVTSGTSTP
jgi:hypothetical protein